jgi:CspA family cold shock protein
VAGGRDGGAESTIEGGATRGVVSEFDDERGLGTVTADDGTAYPFHCTAIADGTRSIANGARVTFDVVAGPLGRTEASALQVLSGWA